jgi:putative transposase
LTEQCVLLNINRPVIYQHKKQRRNQCEVDTRDQLLLRLIDEEYTGHPFWGSRKIRVYLRGLGHTVNRKCVQRLMRILGLAGMAPGPNTSKAHPQHKVYPYLLRGLDIVRPNQVWSTDITYIRLPRGFVYLVAIIDWYSRKVLSWRLSNSMDASFCVDCLQEAILHFGNAGDFQQRSGFAIYQ